MKTLYIFRDGYGQNSAPINRFMAFIKGFSELGINAKVVFVRPNEAYDKVPFKIDNVTFDYLWDGKKIIKGKHFNYIQQICWLMSFLKKLKKGDNVILFGTIEYFLFFSIFKKINFFHEMNEHPDIGRNTNSLIWNLYHKLYLEKCKSLKGLFVISTSLKKYFSDIGVPESKIHIINMIVDSSRFKGLKKNTKIENYIAYCGAIVNRKDGVNILIKAFKFVQEKIPGLKLWIVGGFPIKNDEEANKNIVKDYDLQDKIIFKGEMPSSEIPQLLKNAQALVLARPDNIQAQNGFPTKLGEYLLTSNPVIISNVGDIGLFLKNGESALMVEPDNVKDIADKIYFAVLNKTEAQRIGEKGHEVAMQYFNYKIEAEKICNVIYNKQI